MSFPRPELIVAGGDFGGMGGDPLALELCVRFDDGTWRTLAEYYVKRCTWLEIIDVCRTWMQKYHAERFWWDASQLNSVQALNAAGIPAIATQIRDPDFRHRTLYSLAKARRWRYNKDNCPSLHGEFQLFGYAKTRTGIVRMQERNDHAIDAVTYALCSEGESPEVRKEELPPEERAAYWRDEEGKMRFDSAAVIAQSKSVDAEDKWAPTWDEIIDSDDDDFDTHQRDVWHYLTGKPFPEPGRPQ